MSSSITIPTGRSATAGYHSKAVDSSSGSSYSSSPSPSSPSSSPNAKMLQARRPSLLSSAISKQESTVINIGDPDGPPRLISYLSSSQGFAWNPEIFLPSYVDCDYEPLENHCEPVHEIVLSDEEPVVLTKLGAREGIYFCLTPLPLYFDPAFGECVGICEDASALLGLVDSYGVPGTGLALLFWTLLGRAGFLGRAGEAHMWQYDLRLVMDGRRVGSRLDLAPGMAMCPRIARLAPAASHPTWKGACQAARHLAKWLGLSAGHQQGAAGGGWTTEMTSAVDGLARMGGGGAEDRQAALGPNAAAGLPPGGKASEQLDVLAWEETPWKVGIRGLQTMERLDQDKFDHGLPSMRNRPARLGLCLGTSSTEHDSARPRWTGAFTLGHLASPGVQYAMPRNLAVVIAIASKQCALVLRTLQQGLPKPSCRRAASRFKQSVPGHVVERTQLDIHGSLHERDGACFGTFRGRLSRRYSGPSVDSRRAYAGRRGFCDVMSPPRGKQFMQGAGFVKLAAKGAMQTVPQQPQARLAALSGSDPAPGGNVENARHGAAAAQAPPTARPGRTSATTRRCSARQVNSGHPTIANQRGSARQTACLNSRLHRFNQRIAHLFSCGQTSDSSSGSTHACAASPWPPTPSSPRSSARSSSRPPRTSPTCSPTSAAPPPTASTRPSPPSRAPPAARTACGTRSRRSSTR
ncbi:hypothetical protein Purlil1_1362 [Purpureocillium lilacinum]|uniref:Uncharacterized protein n=1 Tax=Purpureocillium lilacinum TaxID=33203 RepID=A0ABR0CD81_PURLI|nr:hypothetical protein Purlil1_1362 [Purpureocillium lilacinum]